MSDQVRVLVVDDSAYNRRTITKILETISGVEVVGYAVDGQEGLRKVFDLKPDLITLDLEMPRLDGFAFLRILMQNQPLPVIVVSARAEDENVFRALEYGAVEFVAKPAKSISPDLINIQEDLVRKVQAVARADMNKILDRPRIDAPPAARRPAPPPPPRRRHEDSLIEQVVIGASTGGPPALQGIFAALKQSIPVGFAIAQHMPPGFTRAFAERLNKFSGLEISEARSGDVMTPGRVLIAPGGKNLVFQMQKNQVLAHVVDPSPGQRYVPSADALFKSASEIYNERVLGVVLTGMGNDGAEGIKWLKKRGGQTLAEDESTSVVFGMPKEAIATGKVDEVKPLPEICREILRRCGF